MNLTDWHFTEDFKNLTANTTDTNDENLGIEKRGSISIDEFEHFVGKRDWIFHIGL